MGEATRHPSAVPEGTQAASHDTDKDSAIPKDLLAVGSVLAAIAASSCCVIPFVLFTLGISGAWMGSLTALEPYQPYFVVLALGFLGAGFYITYRKPKAVVCQDGYCATPASDRIVKTALWVATVLVAVALAWPYVVPLLLGE
jgi:mercuric ion transport protein